jgi:hypothetical protein
LVTPGTLVSVNGLGLGNSDVILDIRLEVDCDSNVSGGGYNGEPDSDVAEMTIRLEVDSDSNDSDGGYDGEPDSDAAETTTPSDEGYAGETDGDEINIGVAAGIVGSASGTGLNSGTSVVGTNSTGLIRGASIEATSGLGCLVLAVSNMATLCLEGNFSNRELPPVKQRPLRGTRILSKNRKTSTGVKVGSDAHTWVMTSGAKVA